MASTRRVARGRIVAGDWRGAVVFCGGTAWDGNRFPDQHIAERLTGAAPVLYVDPPISPVSARRDPDAARAPVRSTLRPISDRLMRLTPLVAPGRSRRVMQPVTAGLTRRAIGRAVRTLGADVDVLVAATLLPVFGAAGERRRVLYGTDDFAAGAVLMGIDPAWVARRQRAALAAADVTIVVSESLGAKWADDGRAPVVVENGVDVDLFATTDDAPWPDDVDLPAPIAGFVGHLSDRIDLRMLEAVADRGCSLLLVGPRQLSFEIGRLDDLLRRPNVQWVGQKPFESLPSYLRAMRVGLLPYTDTEFNRSSSPLKVLEYVAARRPAVVTDLPAIRGLGPTVHIESDPTRFADVVSTVLSSEPSSAGIDAGLRVARQRSWDAAAARFADAIGIT